MLKNQKESKSEKLWVVIFTFERQVRKVCPVAPTGAKRSGAAEIKRKPGPL